MQSRNKNSRSRCILLKYMVINLKQPNRRVSFGIQRCDSPLCLIWRRSICNHPYDFRLQNCIVQHLLSIVNSACAQRPDATTSSSPYFIAHQRDLAFVRQHPLFADVMKSGTGVTFRIKSKLFHLVSSEIIAILFVLIQKSVQFSRRFHPKWTQ